MRKLIRTHCRLVYGPRCKAINFIEKYADIMHFHTLRIDLCQYVLALMHTDKEECKQMRHNTKIEFL